MKSGCVAFLGDDLDRDVGVVPNVHGARVYSTVDYQPRQIVFDPSLSADSVYSIQLCLALDGALGAKGDSYVFLYSRAHHGAVSGAWLAVYGLRVPVEARHG